MAGRPDDDHENLRCLGRDTSHASLKHKPEVLPFELSRLVIVRTCCVMYVIAYAILKDVCRPIVTRLRCERRCVVLSVPLFVQDCYQVLFHHKYGATRNNKVSFMSILY